MGRHLHRAEHHKLELKKFYKKIQDAILGSQRIFVLGPGPAKTEFRSEMNSNEKFVGIDIKFQPADYMTYPQIIAELRKCSDGFTGVG